MKSVFLFVFYFPVVYNTDPKTIKKLKKTGGGGEEKIEKV